ncbi:MAG: hypothetical protein Q4G34_00230, partial [Micrococcus sp.]|nr:hypothetical protein [Micrococcus sp.]
WSRVPYRTRQHIKQLLLARDGLRCCVCGTKIPSPQVATIEHKRERSAGGALLDLANLGLAHSGCNYGRLGRKGRVPLIAAAGFFRRPAPAHFFDDEHAEHPAPRVVPSPGDSEKTGGTA